MIKGQENFVGYAQNPLFKSTGVALAQVGLVEDKEYKTNASYYIKSARFGTVSTDGFNGVLPKVFLDVDATMTGIKDENGEFLTVVDPRSMEGKTYDPSLADRDKTLSVHYVLDENELVSAIKGGYYENPSAYTQQVSNTLEKTQFHTDILVKEREFTTVEASDDIRDSVSKLRLVEERLSLLQTDGEHAKHELNSDLSFLVNHVFNELEQNRQLNPTASLDLSKTNENEVTAHMFKNELDLSKYKDIDNLLESDVTLEKPKENEVIETYELPKERELILDKPIEFDELDDLKNIKHENERILGERTSLDDVAQEKEFDVTAEQERKKFLEDVHAESNRDVSREVVRLAEEAEARRLKQLEEENKPALRKPASKKKPDHDLEF